LNADGSTRATSIPPWIAQRGVAGRRIAGRVLVDSAPAVGATVRLAVVVWGMPQQLAERSTKTDGSFDFGIQMAAGFEVSAEATGRTPASVKIELADPTTKPDQITLHLGVCRARLYGTIVDASGGPIAKARLRVASLGGTDADGTGKYSLCVPSRDSLVRVEADGYSALEIPIHLHGELHHDFELVPEAVVSGHVVDEMAKPVPGARVVAMPDPSEFVHFVGNKATTADNDGRFRITNLAPARFRLVAFGDGVSTQTQTPIIAAPGANAKEIELVVVRNARVTGRVVMAGKPVAGARVSLADRENVATAGFSQADGTFVIDNVPRGRAKLVAPPYEVKEPRELVVDKAALTNIEVEVASLATIVGRVSRHDKPVPNAHVHCTRLEHNDAVTDADGNYTLRGVSAGACSLEAYEMSNILAWANKNVTLASGETKRVDMELAAGGRVRGVVVDESGTAVPGVYVLLDNSAIGDMGESMTDGAGAFECATMVGGEYTVAVYASPAGGTPFPPVVGERHPTITLKDGNDEITGVRIAIKHDTLSIKGHVLDDTGAPVADVHVEAFGKQGFTLPPSVRADGNGGFEIPNLTRGTYVVHAHAADSSEVEVSGVAAGTANLELRLVKPGSIEGTVVGFSQRPQINALQITANLAVGNNAILDGDHFTIPGLTPGKYRVDARAGTEADGATVDVKAGAVSKITLTSRGRGTVDGRVLEFGTKAPIANATCIASMSIGGVESTPDPSLLVSTDEAGRFVSGAPIGKVRVRCNAPPGSTLSNAGTDVEVGATEPAHVEVYQVKIVAPPSDIGFQITPITLPLTVWKVDPTGPAAAAGLAPGDRVASIDGAAVAGLLPFTAMVVAMNHRPGSTLTLGIERGGTPMAIKINITKPQN
jgi:PDZ domain-containing protein/carboxypeptidase family protein